MVQTRPQENVWLTPDAIAVLVLSGLDRGLSAPLRTTLSVGSSEENDLVVRSELVSRTHAVFERREDGILVRDTGSTNGVWIGGARVTSAMVGPGTIVAIGDTELMVRVEPKGAVVPPSTSDQFGSAVGRSLAMRRVFGLLERAALGTATILLLGETGTGKDVLARSIHQVSPRARGPFEVLDCSAIAGSLIESELFGHEKGAFTGAIDSRPGVFERAHGGTVFLDEIGELPGPLQSRLLRVLESREVRRVGGSKSTRVDVRIIAATTRDLEQDALAGAFREDLYFRLAVVPVHVPPLRSHLEDIPELASRLLASLGAAHLTLSQAALDELRSHPWPGNVRELRNALERVAALAHASGDLVVDHVPLRAPRSTRMSFPFVEGMTYRDAKTLFEDEFEAAFVDWILRRTDGNVAAAARLARMDRKYLGDLVKKHQLRKE